MSAIVKNINSLFRISIEEYKYTPSEKVWDKINKSLDLQDALVRSKTYEKSSNTVKKQKNKHV